MKILVTTGTGSDYLFTRLLKIVDELCDEQIIDRDELFVQTTDKFISTNFKVISMLPENVFTDLLTSCDVIISHAGTGNVTRALKIGKKVILFPRRKKYGEHGDDHQLDLCSLFYELGYVLVANDKKELESCLSKIDNFHPKQFVSSNEKINRIILDIIEG